jgi:hypothetical protein
LKLGRAAAKFEKFLKNLKTPKIPLIFAKILKNTSKNSNIPKKILKFRNIPSTYSILSDLKWLRHRILQRSKNPRDSFNNPD